MDSSLDRDRYPGRDRSTSPSRHNYDRGRRTCYKCGKDGHMSFECPKRSDSPYRAASVETEKHVSFVDRSGGREQS